MSYDDFSEVIKWLKTRKENGNSWKVKVEDIKEFNLDVKNPNDIEVTQNLSPHELIDTILKDEEKTIELLKEVKKLIDKEIPK